MKKRKRLTRLVKQLEHALAWCGGASDFQKGGFAERGWKKVARPALEAARRYRRRHAL